MMDSDIAKYEDFGGDVYKIARYLKATGISLKALKGYSDHVRARTDKCKTCNCMYPCTAARAEERRSRR